MNTYTFGSKFTTKIEDIKANLPMTHSFTIVYTHGLCSAPWGKKPEAIKRFCREHNLGFIRFELAGHGSDSQNYEKTDINIWKAQLLEIIDNLVEGPVLLMGSSMGGWLSLLGATERPQRVIGVIGLAAAPDFTVGIEDKILTPEQKEILKNNGKIALPTKDFTYIFTQQLLQSGRENRLLDKDIPLSCPIHLIQGMQDMAYPWKYALEIVNHIPHNQVTLKLLKQAGHRLNSPEEIAEILKSIEAFMK